MTKFFRAAAAVLAASFLSAAPVRAQTAPTVTGNATGPTAIAWTWTLTGGATGYRVLSSTNPGANISGDLSGSANSFTLTGLSTNTLGAIQVEAFGAGFAVDAATNTVRTLAAQPTGTAVLFSSQNKVTLNWQTNGNESAGAGISYIVNWTSGTGVGVQFSTNPAVIAGTATATINDLPGGQTINFSVAALNAAGVAGPFDLIVTTGIPAIDNQSVISSATFANGISSITWFWTPSTGSTRYQLFSAAGTNLSGALSSATLTFTQTGLLANTSYTSYVESFDGVTTTNTAPFTRFTLAAPPASLTLLGLSSATAASDSETEQLSWSANGNPAGTLYSVQWWTNITSTVTVSTGATTAVIGNLFAGSTIFFAVSAQNGESIATAFSNTVSTQFAVASQVVPAGFAGALTFVVPNGAGTGAGVVTVMLTSGTFPTAVNFTVSTPSASGTPFPAVPAGFTDLPSPIHLTISAEDAANPGTFLQPRYPVSILVNYSAANFATNASSLEIARFDSARGVWIPLATSKVGSSLRAVTDHLSSFAVLGLSSGSDLTQITVGPNPLRPILNAGQIMTFRNMPAGARVRLFSYLGEKLVDLTADGGGVAGWDGRNRNGTFVASGVYIAVIEAGGTKKTLRVAIER